MKNISIVIVTAYAILLLFSCSGSASKLVDPRPKDELKFLSQVIKLDSLISSAPNSILKEELTDSSLAQISTYTKTQLSKGFHNWVAEVIEINNEPYGVPGVNMRYMLKKNFHDNENPKYSSVIFEHFISKSDKKRVDLVKRTREGDQVIIDGDFIYKHGKLDILSVADNIMSNPALSVVINDLKIKEPSNHP